MNCIHCGNLLAEGAKFCGKCGKGVSSEKPIENKKSLSGSQIIKKIFQIGAVILFILSLATISSDYNAEGWLEDIHNVFVITAVITFFALITNSWQNRKKGKNKKWFGWRWIIFLIILSLLGLGSAILSRAVTVAQEKVAVAIDNWDIYSAPESNFSVRFPSTPMHDTQQQDTPNGRIKVDTYKQADHTASILYSVNVSEFLDGNDLSDSKTILESSVNLSAKNGTVLQSKEITNNGYPAISYSIEISHPYGITRIKGLNILIGNRLYQLITGYDKPQENLLEYDKFVDSFKMY